MLVPIQVASEDSPSDRGVFIFFVLPSMQKGVETMKTISQPSAVSPSILVLALLFAAVVFIGYTSKKVPLLTSVPLILYCLP